MAKKRTSTIKRKTRETDITVKLNIDGSGKTKIDTGIGILDHLLELFAFHGLFDLEIKAKGDLKVDIHHTNEDVGITLGEAFKKALGKKEGIKRFGSASVPMEDVTASVVVDISGRGHLTSPLKGQGFAPDKKEGYEAEYAEHFFDALATHLGMNLNIKFDFVSSDLHTTLEPAFKALGLALEQAVSIDPRRKGVPSTKGVID
ncbi:MAG: imidazoleglycerol-phosphate dehydratase HisB [Candidatus Omnitrophica bacterium]|nr:imidazoleglycerol-phosphate dehydratase HisB [Candidatus Omnitrophota bacterium]MDD5236542.1 imidazoleglycerol-phosphate dehydratase HisB [Candidatus Omnitrophota bacterium]MDD5611268.1 imidazoleglycerol-phosphate dehydratase HisB [Candidatus Omnitrophota bacterium]